MASPRYDLVDHVCKHCLGRLLYDPWREVTLCPDCGAETNGTPESACMCGPVFMCAKNPAPGPSNPAAIVAMERPAVNTLPGKRQKP